MDHLPYTVASQFGVFEALETLNEYVVWCRDNAVNVPLDFYEGLFYCMPDFICELFDFDFIRFYDHIVSKGDNYEP